MDKNFNQNPNFGQNQNLNQNFNQNPNFNQYRNYGYVTTMRSNSSKQRIRSLILLICFTLTILITSVYAWFSTQKNVSLNNIKGKVEVAEGLQISIDAETWEQEIKFGENNTTKGNQFSNNIVSDWSKYDIGVNATTTNNIRPFKNSVGAEVFNRTAATSVDASTGYMLPVSCAGSLSADSKRLMFYTGTYSGKQLSKIAEQPEVMEAGFYAFDAYLMNTTKGSDADTLYLDQNSVVREIKEGESNDYGLKNTVRVGLAFYDDGENGSSTQVCDTTSKKEDILTTTQDATIKRVAIWEPNYDTHSSYVMKQNDKLRNLATNSSGVDNVAEGANVINTYAVNFVPTANGNIINDVYTTNTTSTGLAETKYPIRTVGKVTKVNNAEGEEITANDSGIKVLKDVKTDDYVQLTANKISKVRVYIWLEGQDPDCINWASHSEGLDITIGLVKTAAGKRFQQTSKCTNYETDLEDQVYSN